MTTTLPQSVALLDGDAASDLRMGRTLGARYAPPAVKPSDLARLAAGHVADLAEHVASGSDLAHRTQHVQRALRAWGIACDAEIRGCPASVAADALDRLAAWQDNDSGRGGGTCCHECDEARQAVITSRGEAARAMEALFDALPEADEVAADEADEHARVLRLGAPRQSATLRKWSASWRAYAATSNGGLPPWPRWRGVPRSPVELVAIVARVEGDAAAVVQLSEDIKAWASAYDARQETSGEVAK